LGFTTWAFIRGPPYRHKSMCYGDIGDAETTDDDDDDAAVVTWGGSKSSCGTESGGWKEEGSCDWCGVHPPSSHCVRRRPQTEGRWRGVAVGPDREAVIQCLRQC